MVIPNDANMNVNMNVTCLIDADDDAVERYDYAPYGQVAVFDDDWSAATRSRAPFPQLLNPTPIPNS